MTDTPLPARNDSQNLGRGLIAYGVMEIFAAIYYTIVTWFRMASSTNIAFYYMSTILYIIRVGLCVVISFGLPYMLGELGDFTRDEHFARVGIWFLAGWLCYLASLRWYHAIGLLYPIVIPDYGLFLQLLVVQILLENLSYLVSLVGVIFLCKRVGPSLVWVGGLCAMLGYALEILTRIYQYWDALSLTRGVAGEGFPHLILHNFFDAIGLVGYLLLTFGFGFMGFVVYRWGRTTPMEVVETAGDWSKFPMGVDFLRILLISNAFLTMLLGFGIITVGLANPEHIGGFGLTVGLAVLFGSLVIARLSAETRGAKGLSRGVFAIMALLESVLALLFIILGRFQALLEVAISIILLLLINLPEIKKYFSKCSTRA